MLEIASHRERERESTSCLWRCVVGPAPHLCQGSVCDKLLELGFFQAVPFARSAVVIHTLAIVVLHCCSPSEFRLKSLKLNQAHQTHQTHSTLGVLNEDVSTSSYSHVSTTCLPLHQNKKNHQTMLERMQQGYHA
jgi:hypothetical protein